MSPKSKRNWGIGVIVFFVIMCGAIAYAQYRAGQNVYLCGHHLPGCPYPQKR